MKEFAKIERAVHAIAPSVNVSVENNCVVLRGELDNWDDVVRCGRAAVSKKYLGVINDITLRGYEQKVRLPKINDKLYDGRKPDVLIVGGGISGATIAHELSKWQLDVMLVEKDTTSPSAQLQETTVACTSASTLRRNSSNTITLSKATRCTTNYATIWTSSLKEPGT